MSYINIYIVFTCSVLITITALTPIEEQEKPQKDVIKGQNQDLEKQNVILQAPKNIAGQKSDSKTSNTSKGQGLQANVIANSPTVGPNANNSNADSKIKRPVNHKKLSFTDMDSDSMKRAVIVLVGFSIIFILYLAFKTYRKRNRKSKIIRKYGIRARRNDTEMTPLPLDDEEEDETVFEVAAVRS